MSRLLPILLALAASGLSARAATGFSDYQVIIDKSPFGRVVEKPVIAPPPPPPVEAYSWINDWRLAFIVQTVDNKAKVGLVNVKDQTTAIVETGETHSATGIQLTAVNFEEKTAALAKGGQNHSIKLQDAATAPVAAPGAGNPRVPPAMGSSSGRGGPPSPFGGRPPRPGSPPATPTAPVLPEGAPPRLTGAELEKHLQEYQVEVIRKGLPPLPVQLTPENDAKLVAEGVLPPVDGTPAAPGVPGP